MKSVRRLNKKVVILGGGVAGMSAAHELIERSFEVSVYERGPIPGGKARSVSVEEDGIKGLPGEHGFRFFPGFYKHLPDTMRRILYPGNKDGVLGNLVAAKRIELCFAGRVFPFLTRLPRDLKDLTVLLRDVLKLQEVPGLTAEDVEFFRDRVWQLLTSCEERRLRDLEKIDWWKFIEAERRSPAYQKFFGEMTRVLVAADPEHASAKTVGDIYLQILFDFMEVGTDRVLNGPTNEVWINPWLKYLKEKGVDYHLNAAVEKIHCDDRKITHLTGRENGQVIEVTGDYYVAALPVEAMAELLRATPKLCEIDPKLEDILELSLDVDWMNGIQFYLKDDIRLGHGHQIHLDSPWALTSLSQTQFWPKGLVHYGDGTFKSVISVDISNWKKPGVQGRAAREYATKDGIADEVWAQLQASLPALRGIRRPPYHLDDAIQIGTSPNGETKNREPLLVNKAGRRTLRPSARTRVPNLFLAADYVLTSTDLATMEAANEAARRAVNAIVSASRVRPLAKFWDFRRPNAWREAFADLKQAWQVPVCQTWPLHEPHAVTVWRRYDRARLQNGLRWKAELPLHVRVIQRLMLWLLRLLGPLLLPLLDALARWRLRFKTPE